MKLSLGNIQDRLKIQEEEFNRNVNTRDWLSRIKSQGDYELSLEM